MFATIVGFACIAFAYFYVRPLKKGFSEMSDRASLFAKGGTTLRNEKKALLENLEDGVITLDARGRISYINGRAQNFLKVSREEVLGKSYEEVSSCYAKELWRETKNLLHEVLEKGERRHTSFTLSESQKFYLEIIGVPIEQGKGGVLILQDRSNQQKILEIGKDFIANASHELRTPVTIIRGFAETLKDVPEVSEDMYDSILDKIIRSCERMENLVKSLLTLADLENHQSLEMAECDLVVLMEDVCYTILNLFPNVHIEQLYNRESICIWADSTLLELAFSNILKNAVKYGPPSNVSIKIVIEVKEGLVEVRITDNGIGIPKESLDRIFDRFYTVNKAHSRKLGGAGLGLSIVKIIMNLHKADIKVKSVLAKGTTFTMTFPC